MELNFTGTDICAVNGTRSAPEARYDVVVVGAGPSGIAAAVEHATAGKSVLLVDENLGNLILTEVSKDHSVQEIIALLNGVDLRISESLKCMEDNSSKHNADVDEWEEIEHLFD